MNKKVISFVPGSAPVRVMKQFIPVLAGCGAIVLLAGCASQPEAHTVYSPPPPAPTRSVTTTTTTTTPDTVPGALVGNPNGVVVATTTPDGNTRMVTVAPPALQTDVVLAQPYPADVWIAGYWTWRDPGPGYLWMSGHWEMPPRSNAVWVAPVCQPQGNGYRFTEGYWN